MFQKLKSVKLRRANISQEMELVVYKRRETNKIKKKSMVIL